jgi:hypothetical protein
MKLLAYNLHPNIWEHLQAQVFSHLQNLSKREASRNHVIRCKMGFGAFDDDASPSNGKKDTIMLQVM